MSSTIPRRFADNGARIRKARRACGFSQERFALVVGTTRRHMIRLENGEHLPQAALRDRIAEVSGVDASTLEASDDDEESDALAQTLLSALRQYVNAELTKASVISDIKERA